MASIPAEIKIRPDTWSEFIGEVVFIQLRVTMIFPQIVEARELPYAKNPERQWVPTEARADSKDPKTAGDTLATELIRYAVVTAIRGDMVNFTWTVPAVYGLASVASMVHATDILAITRVVNAPPVPAPEEPKRIVTL